MSRVPAHAGVALQTLHGRLEINGSPARTDLKGDVTVNGLPVST